MDAPNRSPTDGDWSDRPLVLVWEVTRACSLSCDHCRAEAQPNRHPDELTTAEGKSLLDDVRDFGPGQVVVLSGGDPLARDDVADLVAHGADLGLTVSLTPSGVDSLTRERVRELGDAGLRRMALSLDGGSPAAHDDFRGEVGSFEATLGAARAASDAGIPLQINTTVCAETVEELPRIAGLVDHLGGVRWSVFFLVPVGRGRTLTPVSPERSERVMAWLSKVDDEADFAVKTTEAPHYRRVDLQRAHDCDGERVPADALAGRTRVTAGDGFAFVSHVGEVYPSGFLPEPAGNVRDDGVVDLYRNAPLFERLRDPTELSGKCGACRFRGVCGGSRSRAYATTGDPLASDPLCPYVPSAYDGPLPDRQQG